MPESDSLTLPALAVSSSLDLHVAGTATVALAGVFTATGTGSLDVGTVTVTSGVDQTQVGTAAQALSLTLDTSVSAGGIGSAGATLSLVKLTQGTKSWLGVDASGITLSLNVDPLTVSVTNGELKLNRASGVGATPLDWQSLTAATPLYAGIDLHTIDVTAAQSLHISGTATIALSGVFTATGTGSLDLGTVTVTSGADQTQVGTAAQALSLTLDTSVTAGGIGSAGATLSLVKLTQGTKSWLGVDASGITLSLDVDPLTISVTNGELKLNRVSGVGATPVDWHDLTAATPLYTGIDLRTIDVTAAQTLHIAGTATITLSGVFTATGTGSLDLGTVTVTGGADEAQVGTAAQALSLTLDTSVSAGGIGSAGATLSLVQLTQGTKSWLGVDASGITLSLNVDPLTISVTNGELKLNRASGVGATPLDWHDLTAATPLYTGIDLHTIDVTAAQSLHISGTATVALSGVFTATGTGSLDLGTVTVTGGADHEPDAHRCAGAGADPRHLGVRGRDRCRPARR